MNASLIRNHLLSPKKNVYRTGVVILVFFLLKIFFVYTLHKPDDVYPSYRNNNFNVFGLNVPGNLHFCGERIPINNYAIKENLEAEFFNNNYWKSSATLFFSKAQKWFPYIEPILKKEGIPDDFKYVAVIESHLSNVTSPMNAAGFWQLLPSTARKYGLIVNENTDERLDVEKSTTVACKLIADAFKIFKNWTLAAAAYNLGIGGIQTALEKQNSHNYYDLLLNKETGSFVYRILAYKTLFSNPEHFGIKKKALKYFPKIPVRIIKIDSSITNLPYFAKIVHSDVGLIKLFNPWLLQNNLSNPNKHSFEFKIPRKNNIDYSFYYSDLIGENQSETDSLNKKMLVDSISPVLQIITHTVGDKETLKEIADFYEVNEVNLKEWNGIKETTEVKSGYKLIIKKERNLKRGN